MGQATKELGKGGILRTLALDGGGAKGFYTLGVLKEIESMIGCPLHEKFELVFGTSTGAIIASLIALGHSVDSILELYRKHVPTVMSQKTRTARSMALNKLACEVFGDATFSDVKTGMGIVAAKWLTERPMIFKGSVAQAHGRVGYYWHIPIDDKAINHARRKGKAGMRVAAEKRIRSSVGSANPYRDGMQTPKTGNVLYYAQHATSTCCRKCIEDWHGIPMQQDLDEGQIRYFKDLLMLYVEERLPLLTESGEHVPSKRKNS